MLLSISLFKIFRQSLVKIIFDKLTPHFSLSKGEHVYTFSNFVTKDLFIVNEFENGKIIISSHLPRDLPHLET